VNDWDFGAWRTVLAALPSREAALVGLSAAERLAGCLRDERFRRYPGPVPELVGDLLERCWTAVAAAEVEPSPEIRDLAHRIDAYTTEYVRLSLTDLFHSFGPLGDGPAGNLPATADVDGFVEDADLDGAVGLHLDALTALSEAAVACSGGPWDGALRCLQTAAMAASSLPSDAGSEAQRQQRDLEAVQGSADARGLAAELRARSGAEAAEWRRATERLGLHEV
jgi:hypothetical protein